jgi:hypothetical protein
LFSTFAKSTELSLKTGMFVVGMLAGAFGLFAIQRMFRFLNQHWKVLLGVAACVSAVAALMFVL